MQLGRMHWLIGLPTDTLTSAPQAHITHILSLNARYRQ